ncbi:excision repair cross-complementing rodent repair deficiency, complementation group 8-like protein [Mycotypha africana]|uniref:excision repair cross-complementing rodent repair deficiency, complementation group 8-like protein n=1 Tax=Mycotypha africana TaxID=64632 RepID=UPI002300E60B|nr:excision repair cross-complementing rodent repair deficiency, complementation group 8-like protein [Mycotypha africana]KAI8979634.1 excision repair cross-complementing rodent repair deficiency, complementation group 8-like protein [Mycotypha africana]
MYSFLKKREYGLIAPLQLKRAEITKRAYNLELSKTKELALFQRGGVSALQVDCTEQKYLLTGGGDGKVHVFDLDFQNRENKRNEPIGSCERGDRHKYAVTSVSWYPFDTGIFITSSHDTTIKVWDTNTMKPEYEFALESRVNCQAISPIASHCLVASAAAEPRVRLCDLNNGAFTHTLTGHSGSVLSCTWSTTQEFILYSGGDDRTIRVWDIRRAASCLMSLDQDNAVDRDPLSDTNFAHGRGVNGLVMTKDGQFLVSLGLDEKIRLWDTATGHNTFVNYGTAFRNRYYFYLTAAISDQDVWPPLLYIPSDDRQVLLYKLLDGQLVRRLKGAYGRVTSVATRHAFQEIYSGSNANDILIWEPSLEGTKILDEFEEDDLDAWSASDEEAEA